MKNNIEGKVIVITGAGRGKGESVARHLAREGAVVVLGARRNDRIQALQRQFGLKKAGYFIRDRSHPTAGRVACWGRKMGRKKETFHI